MFVLVTSTYPHDKAIEVGKAFIKTLETPLPSFVKFTVYVTSTELGIKGYVLYEIEDKKLAEGIREVIKRQVAYHNIVGYRWNIETLLTAEEALPLVGLAPP